MRASPTRGQGVHTSELRNCACFNLRKAARAVTQLYNDSLRPCGLRVTQFSLLTVIRLTGGASMTTLAGAAVMDRTTLARNLGVLARKGLIELRAGGDARVREVTLTAAGRAKLSAAERYWVQAQTHMTHVLGRARLARLLVDLKTTVEAGQARSPNK